MKRRTRDRGATTIEYALLTGVVLVLTFWSMMTLRAVIVTLFVQMAASQ